MRVKHGYFSLVVLIAVINTIWWNQNNIVFQDGSGEVGVMVDAVIHKAWLWLKAKEKVG